MELRSNIHGGVPASQGPYGQAASSRCASGRLELMPEDSAEANLAAFDPALAQAARALRDRGFLPAAAAGGGSDGVTLALSSSSKNLQARQGLMQGCAYDFFCHGWQRWGHAQAFVVVDGAAGCARLGAGPRTNFGSSGRVGHARAVMPCGKLRTRQGCGAVHARLMVSKGLCASAGSAGKSAAPQAVSHMRSRSAGARCHARAVLCHGTPATCLDAASENLGDRAPRGAQELERSPALRRALRSPGADAPSPAPGPASPPAAPAAEASGRGEAAGPCTPAPGASQPGGWRQADGRPSNGGAPSGDAGSGRGAAGGGGREAGGSGRAPLNGGAGPPGSHGGQAGGAGGGDPDRGELEAVVLGHHLLDFWTNVCVCHMLIVEASAGGSGPPMYQVRSLPAPSPCAVLTCVGCAP